MVEEERESSKKFFQEREETGLTEKPDATNTPNQIPYVNPPLHHPFILQIMKWDIFNRGSMGWCLVLFNYILLHMHYCMIQSFKPCYPNLRPAGFGSCTDFKYHLNIQVKWTGGFPISFREIGQGKGISSSWQNVSLRGFQFLEHVSSAYTAGWVFSGGQHLNQILACVSMLMDGSGWVWVGSIHFQVQVDISTNCFCSGCIGLSMIQIWGQLGNITVKLCIYPASGWLSSFDLQSV